MHVSRWAVAHDTSHSQAACGGLPCKPGAERKTDFAGQQPYSRAKPVSACLHPLAPQLTVTDCSIWHARAVDPRLVSSIM